MLCLAKGVFIFAIKGEYKDSIFFYHRYFFLIVNKE